MMMMEMPDEYEKARVRECDDDDDNDKMKRMRETKARNDDEWMKISPTAKQEETDRDWDTRSWWRTSTEYNCGMNFLTPSGGGWRSRSGLRRFFLLLTQAPHDAGIYVADAWKRFVSTTSVHSSAYLSWILRHTSIIKSTAGKQLRNRIKNDIKSRYDIHNTHTVTLLT